MQSYDKNLSCANVFKEKATFSVKTFIKLEFIICLTPIRDKIAISCMLIQIREFSSHAITHELYIKNRKRLFCL